MFALVESFHFPHLDNAEQTAHSQAHARVPCENQPLEHHVTNCLSPTVVHLFTG